MTDWDKFKETKLPPREAFYSKLNMTGVKGEDYEHANRVWKEFGLKDLGEYHDLYFKMDAILLAKVVIYYTPGHFLKSATGGLVHHYYPVGSNCWLRGYRCKIYSLPILIYYILG